MAIIGFYDWDLVRWRQATVFSLPLMKMARYQKARCRNIVKMMETTDTSQLSRLFLFKDYEDFDYPAEIVQDEKSEFIGLAINNGKPVQLAAAIENCPADTSIYEDLEKYYRENCETKRLFKIMMKALHLQLSKDGEVISPSWQEQLPEATKRLFYIIIHDKEPTKVKGAATFLREVLCRYGRKNARIGFKFPLHVYSDEELLTWGNFAKISKLGAVYLHTLVKDETLDIIAINRQELVYVIDNDHWTKESFLEALPQIFLQSIFLFRWAIPLSLKIEQDFPIEDEWRTFATFMNEYTHNSVYFRNVMTFSGAIYMKYIYDKLQIPEKIELFSFIRDNLYPLFEFLNDVEYVQMVEGKFIPCRYSWTQVDRFGGLGGAAARAEWEKRRREREDVYNYAEDLVITDFIGGKAMENYTNQEIFEKVTSYQQQIKEIMSADTFVLDERIGNLFTKISEMQEVCKHEFHDGICIYCSKGGGDEG